MEQSARLTLSYISPQQAQKHVTVNETFRRLDALVQCTVISATTDAEPASPEEGDAYILTGAATGDDWAAFDENDIAVFQDGAWTQIAPVEGWRVWVRDAAALVVWDGAEYANVATDGGVSEFGELGVNTAADGTNKFAVKSDAILFSHDDVTPGTGDIQAKLNKAASGDTASFLFQDAFSGRAEFGLIGDDDFTLKVAADGSAWNDAIVIDRATGNVTTGRNLLLATNNFSDIDDATTALNNLGLDSADWGLLP